MKEKEKLGAAMVRVEDMTTGMLRKEMKMIEEGINLSNLAKKESLLSRVGHSLTIKS